MAQQSDDPFADVGSGRTFILPTPGARAARARDEAPRGAAQAGADVAADIAAPESGLNPLVALANPLLALVPQIRATSRLADPAALKESIAQALRDFEARARAQGLSSERVLAARYILCTVLDEAAAGTPWGGSGQWARHNLLVTFHNEAYGGEKVFQLMAKLAENPTANRDLLELIFAAVTLGFEGRYKVIEGGTAQLEAVRARLSQILVTARGDHAAALAEHWQGAPRKRRAFLSWLPLWVSGALAALVLAGVYIALLLSLHRQSDLVYAQIMALRLTPTAPPAAPAAPPPAAPARLAPFLAKDVAAGLVAVRDDFDKSLVTLKGDGLFQPAAATLSPERDALVRRIGDALVKAGGRVLVTGHTDNVPIRSARFPSNWQLSQERAQTVRELLVQSGVAADRVRAEGRADGEPVVPNDTPQSRALNRRVEVQLFATAR